VAYVVVVLGGLGSVAGAVAGAFAVGLVEVFSGYLVDTQLKQALYFVVFVLVLLVRPQGLMGRRGAETLGFERTS
jgi:branched-chain amino acid transport system permease protein